MIRIDLTGKVFGFLTVLSYDGFRNKRGFWLCRCHCGNEASVQGPYLRNGHTQSCGCLRNSTKASQTHGLSKSPEYKSFSCIKARTTNPRNVGYKDYGGRGIRCLYASFDEFFADVGPRPSPKYSIGRIDNDDHYRPGNCRWETKKEQANNKRNNIILEWCGERLNVSQWADKLGLDSTTILYRLKSGWSTDAVLNTPLQPKLYELDGKRMSLREWGDFLDISPDTLRTRLNMGWSVERTFRAPLRSVESSS